MRLVSNMRQVLLLIPLLSTIWIDCLPAEDELTAVVNKAWQEAIASVTVEDSAGCWLLCQQAFHRQDVELLLRRWQGQWTGLARLDRRGDFLHAVTVVDCRDGAQGLQLAVRAQLPVPGASPDHLRFGVVTDVQPRRGWFDATVDLHRGADGRLLGSFALRDQPVDDRAWGWWDADGRMQFWRSAWRGALDGRDLLIDWFWNGVAAEPIAVRSPTWNKSEHRLEQDSAERGRLLLVSDGWVPTGGSQTVTVSWQQTVAQGRLTGHYRLQAPEGGPLPSTEGSISGRYWSLCPRLPNAGETWQSRYAALRQLQAASSASLPPDAAPSAAWMPGMGRPVTELVTSDLLTVLQEPSPTLVIQGHRPGPDPAFGPWYGDTATLEQDGPTQTFNAAGGWQGVGSWAVLGPLPAAPERAVPALPPLLPADDGAAVDPIAEATAVAWHQVDATDGWLQVPNSEDGPSVGDDGWRSFLTARIQVDEAIDLHLAASVGDCFSKWGGNDRARVRLWVDGRLRWISDETERYLRSPQLVLPLQWQSGEHRILVELRAEKYQALRFRCHLRRDAAPRDSADVAAARARIEAGMAAAPPLTGRGFRGNYQGHFPAAEPVLAWDPAGGANIRWRQPLPSWSNATPLAVGDAIYVLSEPHFLHCFDAANGAARWRRMVSPAADWDPSRLGRLHRDMAATIEDGLSADPAALAALGADDPQAELDNETRKKLKRQVDRRQSAARDELRVPSMTWGSFMGSTFASPASDGDIIAVKLGSGVTACYEADGELRWMLTEPIHPNVYQTASPVIVDDRMICVWRAQKKGTRGHSGKSSEVVARHLDDGREIWRTAIDRTSAGGTPVPVRLSDGAEIRTVLVTANGVVLDAADGTVLHPHIGYEASAGWTNVTVVGDVVVIPLYFGRIAAVRLYLHEGRVAAVPLWEPLWWGGGTHHFFTGDYAVAVDGRIFTNTIVKEHELKSPVGWQLLDIIDLASGHLLRRVKPVIRDVGHCYTPLSAAGPYLFLVDSGAPSGGCFPKRPGGPDHESLIGVVDSRNGQVLATTPMRRMQAPPLFVGERTYVRTHDELLCLAETGPEGAAYEREALTRQLFDELSRWPEPSEAQPLELAPQPRQSTEPGAEELRLGGGQIALLRAVGTRPFDPSATGWDLDRLPTLGGEWGGRQWQTVDPAALTGVGLSDCHIDVAAFLGNQVPVEGWLAGVLQVGRRQAIRLDATLQGGVWLGGQRLEQGKSYGLQPGSYPFYLHLSMSRRPPVGIAVQARLRLQREADPLDAWRAWCAQVRPYTDRLRAVLASDAEGPAAFQAKRYLHLIDTYGG